MEHDPKLKGSVKRRRSESPGLEKTRISCSYERKNDNYYNNAIEERIKEQEEQHRFLTTSLAGLIAELKRIPSRQVPVAQGVAWNQPPANQAINYGPPQQIPMMYQFQRNV